MTESEKQATAQLPEPPQNKKRLWLWILLAIVILILAVPPLLLAMFLAPWQEIQPVVPTAKDFSVQYKVMRKISKSFSRKKIPEQTILLLTPEEVKSLFKLAGNTKPSKLQFPIRYLQPDFNSNGVFSLTIPYRLKDFKLPGRAVYIRASFKLSKDPGKDLVVTITSLKANGLTLPESIVQKVQQKIEAEMKKSQAEVAKYVDKISTENGKLLILYKPQAVMFRLMSR